MESQLEFIVSRLPAKRLPGGRLIATRFCFEFGEAEHAELARLLQEQHRDLSVQTLPQGNGLLVADAGSHWTYVPVR